MEVLSLKTPEFFNLNPFKVDFQNLPVRHKRPGSHDPFLRIRFLFGPKIGLSEHIENDLLTHGSVILKKRMGIEHALFSSDTLLERRRQILHDIPVIVLAPN